MTWIDELPEEERKGIEMLKMRTKGDCTPKMLEDETLFYRFMKARDFNLENAEAMLRKHIDWRKEFDVDTILSEKQSELFAKYAPFRTFGFDKQGRPVVYVDVGGWDMKGFIRLGSLRNLIKFFVGIFERDMENLRKQSQKLGKLLTKVMYIANFEGLTLAKVTHKATLERIILFAKKYQDNYPERVQACYAINVSQYVTLGFNFVKPVMAPVLVQKFQFFNPNTWKDVLLDLIDADVLPAFLGGNRTDPDGDPLCKTFINHGTIIPEDLYLRKSQKVLSQAEGVKKISVSRFSQAEISFLVENQGSSLEWEFETKNRDIGFEFYYKDRLADDIRQLIPKQRIDTYFEPETNTWKCERPGIYTIVFDNSYSWLFSKEIYYRVKITASDEIENQAENWHNLDQLA